jgi:predicted YcjX-like family ATPase
MAEGNSKGWTFDSFETWVNATNDERAKAIDAALLAATKVADMHNDLIRRGERDAANYVTKDQAALQFKGLAIALGAIAALCTIVGAIIIFSGGQI